MKLGSKDKEAVCNAIREVAEDIAGFLDRSFEECEADDVTIRVKLITAWPGKVRVEAESMWFDEGDKLIGLQDVEVTGE